MQTTALGPLTLCLLPLATASPQADQTDVAEGAPAVEIEVNQDDLAEHEAHVIVLDGSPGTAGQRVIRVELDGEQIELDDAGRVRFEIEDEEERGFGARVRRGVRAIAGRPARGARGWTARLTDELDDALELDIDIDELAEQIERQLEGLFERESGEVEMHVTVEIDDDRDEAHEDRWEYELEFDDDRSDRGIARWLSRLFDEEEEEEVQRRGRGACEACGCDGREHHDDAARDRGWSDRGWRPQRQGQRRGAGRRAIPFWSEHYRDSQPGPLTPVFPPHDRGWTDRAPHPMGPDGPQRRQADRQPPAPWGPDRGGSEHFRGAPPESNRAPQPMDGWEQTRRELDALRRQLDELRHMLEVR